MANTHMTLSALFAAIANAIRAKTGETGTIVADQFPDAIAGISVGVELPELNNPATAENIESGFQALSGAGEVIEGTASIGMKGRTKIARVSPSNNFSVQASVGTFSTSALFPNTPVTEFDVAVCITKPCVGLFLQSAGQLQFFTIGKNSSSTQMQIVKNEDIFEIYR